MTTQMKEWVEDEMTWSDVYAQRPIEYLEAVARGETPVWDSELKKFVYGDDTTETIGGTTTTKSETTECGLQTHRQKWKSTKTFLSNK